MYKNNMSSHEKKNITTSPTIFEASNFSQKDPPEIFIGDCMVHWPERLNLNGVWDSGDGWTSLRMCLVQD